MQKPNAVVVLDFDGTLTPKRYVSLFNVVEVACLSEEPQARIRELRARYLARFNRGLLSQEDEARWFSETIDIYREVGLTLAQARPALERVRLREGARTLLSSLATRGIPCAVVSSNITAFIAVVLKNHQLMNLVDHVYAVELTYDTAGRIVGFNHETTVFPSEKRYWSQQFADLHNVPHEAILAVGDTPSDASLGPYTEHRLGVAETDEQAQLLAPAMGHVIHVNATIDPVTDWLLEKIETV